MAVIKRESQNTSVMTFPAHDIGVIRYAIFAASTRNLSAFALRQRWNSRTCRFAHSVVAYTVKGGVLIERSLAVSQQVEWRPNFRLRELQRQCSRIGCAWRASFQFCQLSRLSAVVLPQYDGVHAAYVMFSGREAFYVCRTVQTPERIWSDISILVTLRERPFAMLASLPDVASAGSFIDVLPDCTVRIL